MSNENATNMINIPDFNDAVEEHSVPAGEYKVCLVTITSGIDKNQHPYIKPIFTLVDHPTAAAIGMFIGLPHAEMDAKDANRKKLQLNRFREAMGVPSGNIDINEIKGHEAWAMVVQKDAGDFGDKEGKQNEIKRFVSAA